MKIFVIEKDKQFRELIGRCLLENTIHEVKGFDKNEDLMASLAENPDIIILNTLSNKENIDFDISQIKKFNADCNILLLCQPDNIYQCSRLFGKGIYDFITTGKGFTERLLNAVKKINTLEDLRSEINILKSLINRKYDISNAIIGESKTIKKVLTLVEKAISIQNVVVLIQGESGTGKELVARIIHFNSIRKEHPFIAINMDAIPDEMIDSELFGHEKDSQPGAYSRAIGKIEQANHGTIFINEVADLNMNLQIKLIQFIQERTVKRLGSTVGIPIDTRIIAATEKNLPEEIESGRFREDLYYSLLGIPIFLPPLSERENDVIILAEYFLKTFCQDNKLPEKTFSSGARNKLLSHNYPGNVRELNAIVELAAVLSSSYLIDEEHILFSPTQAGPEIFNMEISLREFEIRIIKHFLEKYNNNVVLVAKKLEIGKSKIYNMIKNGEI